MKVHQLPETNTPYRCVGCDQDAKLIVDFGDNRKGVQFCYDCAIGAASIIVEHAEYFRNNAPSVPTYGPDVGTVERLALVIKSVPLGVDTTTRWKDVPAWRQDWYRNVARAIFSELMGED